MVLFIEYPKCSTCKKAKKWLLDNNIDFEDRNIIENTPTEEELRKWIIEHGNKICLIPNSRDIYPDGDRKSICGTD